MAASSNARGFVREAGDWHCSFCNEINFKSRNNCYKCSALRPMLAMEPKPGDWICPFCSNLNFSSRTSCNKCQRQKASASSTNEGVTTVQMPGDWICSSCSNLNFASRTSCRKCNRQKQTSVQVEQRPAPVTIKPGDWPCSSCKEINFGTRTVCRKCGTARPSDGSSTKKDECVICMENQIDSVVTICGHSSMCLTCGAQVRSCPICRTSYNSDNIIRLFHVH